MIALETLSWFAAGVVAGLLHGTLLWRATHRVFVWMPAMGILRMGVVAAVLVVAAVAGYIIVTAMGWAIGFVGVGTWFVRSRTNTSAVCPNIHSRE